MPTLIEHIDAIARHKGRTVLYLTFHDEQHPWPKGLGRSDWEADPIRQQIVSWLDQQGIAWQPCGAVAHPRRMAAYGGNLYLDVPFDESDPQYQKLQAFLEYPDGSGRWEAQGVVFAYLPLESAMRNAHHDEPGYWEREMEAF